MAVRFSSAIHKKFLTISICVILLLAIVPLQLTIVTVKGQGLEGIKFKYRDYIVSDFAIERWVKNNISVVNERDEPVTLQFQISSHYDDTEVPDISPFPQPYTLYLAPGENQTIWYFLDVSYRTGLDPEEASKEGIYNVTVKVCVWDVDNPEDKVEFYINHTIITGSIDKYEPNAVIEGYVYYADTNEPARDVRVGFEGAGTGPIYETFTDDQGYYRIDFYAHKYVDSGKYHGYTLVVENFRKAFFPKPGDHIFYNVSLGRSLPDKFEYSLKVEYTTGYPIWLADIDKDERYIVFAHGHHEIQNPDPEKHGIYFFDTNGTLLWRYLTICQVWGLDLSDDGEYLIATLLWPEEKAILFNKDGDILWDTEELGYEHFESREARISHNNEYVAIGTTPGDLLLLDLQTGDLIWKVFLRGQIRGILFTKDDSIMYVSSGDGYVYKIAVETGEILGSAYVEAWTPRYSLKLSSDEKYLVTISKIGRAYLVDTETMTPLWCIDTRGGGHWVLITPDNSLVFIGSGGSYPVVALDINGNVQWIANSISICAVFFEGTNYFLSSNTVFDYNGNVVYTLEKDLEFAYITKDNKKIIGVDHNGTLLIWEGEIKPPEGGGEEQPPPPPPAGAAKLSIYPEFGPPKIWVNIHGEEFTPNTKVDIYFDDMLINSTVTDDNGIFSTWIRIPSKASPESHLIIARDEVGINASIMFEVTIPCLYVTPDKGPVGSIVQISGTGLGPNQQYMLYFDSMLIGLPLRTNAKGELGKEVSIVIPTVTRGIHNFTLVFVPLDIRSASYERIVSIGFEVTEGVPIGVSESNLAARLDALNQSLMDLQMRLTNEVTKIYGVINNITMSIGELYKTTNEMRNIMESRINALKSEIMEAIKPIQEAMSSMPSMTPENMPNLEEMSSKIQEHISYMQTQLQNTLTNLRNYTYIAMGLAVVALILAIIALKKSV